jgi:Bacterial Ig domain
MRAARVSMALLAGALAACATSGGGATTSQTADAQRPGVVIQSPPSNAQVVVGQSVAVVTTAVDAVGIAQIDLKVNGSTISSAVAPSAGLTSFSAVHEWLPAAVGLVDVSAVAFRADGLASDPMTIAVSVLPPGSTPAPYGTYSGPLPTTRAVAVASGYIPPTYAPATNPPYATAGGYAAQPTTAATLTHPTPTYSTVPTYSTAPTYSIAPTYSTAPTAPPTAPPDGNFSWVIPYNGSSEISDYISYPAGDGLDNVYYDISGMSASPPGNTGTLNVFATCEGLGTEYVTFQVGTQKFGCGSQILARFVTDDSRTGLIKIFAFAGAYVRWTLSGNVAP